MINIFQKFTHKALINYTEEFLTQPQGFLYLLCKVQSMQVSEPQCTNKLLVRIYHSKAFQPRHVAMPKAKMHPGEPTTAI
jgi:hypothetical protein